MAHPKNQDRRTFLKLVATSTSGLALGIHLNGCSNHSTSSSDAFTPNAWVTITPDNRVEVAITKSEMGQNILNVFTTIVAEELDLPPEKIDAQLVSPASKYGSMYTGGSRSVRSLWRPLREAAASAREMLIAAAAQAWDCPPQACKIRGGKVIHDSGQSPLFFNQLIGLAKNIELPDAPIPKPLSQAKYIGKTGGNSLIRQKVTGSTAYGIDSTPDNLVYAALRHAPGIGAKLESLSVPDTIKQHPSTLKVVIQPDFIAVIANNYWHAKKSIDQLQPRWNETTEKVPSSESIQLSTIKTLLSGLAQLEPDPALKEGISSPTYTNSFQAHVTMEPMNCTVHIHDDGCDVWVPTQDATAVKGAVAKYLRSKLTNTAYKVLRKLGIDDNIKIHPTFCGGGFGRRLEMDYVYKAIDIAKHTPYPVKAIWPREDDIQNDFYRPLSAHQIQAKLTSDGHIVGWHHGVAGAHKGKITANITNFPYLTKNFSSSFFKFDAGVPVGYWRSVSYSNHTFATECFVDQLARKYGIDPISFRQKNVKDARGQAILNRLSELKQASTTTNKAFGVAYFNAYESYAGLLVEISGTKEYAAIDRIYCVADCGIAVQPDNVRAQLEGGIVFGLGAAIKHAISVENGRIAQSNFDNYPLINSEDCPEISVELAESHAPPGGAGELSVPLVAPALANALLHHFGRQPNITPFTLSPPEPETT